MPTLHLDQSDMNELVQLVYNRWTQEYDALKRAKELRWDGACPKDEWPMFKEQIVANNTKREQKYKALLDQVKHLAKYE